MEKENNMHKHMNSFSKGIETTRYTQVEMLEIKNIITEMKNAF